MFALKTLNETKYLTKKGIVLASSNNNSLPSSRGRNCFSWTVSGSSSVYSLRPSNYPSSVAGEVVQVDVDFGMESLPPCRWMVLHCFNDAKSHSAAN